VARVDFRGSRKAGAFLFDFGVSEKKETFQLVRKVGFFGSPTGIGILMETKIY